jgi:hypothetical protein
LLFELSLMVLNPFLGPGDLDDPRLLTLGILEMKTLLRPPGVDILLK